VSLTQRPISLAELAVHLSGGTAVEYLRMRRTLGRRRDWLRLTPDAWRRAGLPARRAERLRSLATGDGPRRELARARALGVTLVAHRHPDYPTSLRHLDQPPLLLNVRGRWPPPPRALAIVGARAATPTGRHAAEELAAAASAAGVAVVSGLARGIDRCALSATVEEGGWPVAVLGCGIDVVYPPENVELQEEVARRGTLVSEFPFGTRPDRWTFPRRNRILAALSDHVLVVEAGARSGALITAGFALDLGRDVWAVPGAVDSPQSMGTNRLIFDGALPVLGPRWLRELLGHAGATAAGVDARGDAEEEPVLAALSGRSLTVDEVATAADVDARTARSHLVRLEVEGAVRRLAGGRYARRRRC